MWPGPLRFAAPAMPAAYAPEASLLSHAPPRCAFVWSGKTEADALAVEVKQMRKPLIWRINAELFNGILWLFQMRSGIILPVFID